MNIYVIRITKSGLTSVDVIVDGSFSDEKEDCHPFCEYVSIKNGTSILGISIAVADDRKTSSNASWKNLSPAKDGTLPIFENTVEANQEEAAHILLQLSDILPLPGSHSLHIVFDFRGRDILDSPISTDLVGALTKLCQWHRGRLEVYTDCELSNHHLTLFDCIDSRFRIHSCTGDGEAVYKVSIRELWTGSLLLYGDNADQHELGGFTMLIPDNAANECIVVSTTDDSKAAMDFTVSGNVWIGPKIKLASLIDVTTLPATYYCGRNFELCYKKDDEYQEHFIAVESIFNSLFSNSSLAYLCHLHYAISDTTFHCSSKLTSTQWRQSVMDDAVVNDAADLAFPSNATSLYFLLNLPRKDEDVMKFSCVVLKRNEDFDWKIPRQFALSCEAVDDCNDSTLMSRSREPLVNIFPLIKRYLHFKMHTSKALIEWMNNHVEATSIASNELQTIIDESLRHISAEIAKSWKRCVGVMGPLTIHSDNFISNFIYETQKEMLHRFEIGEKANSENRTDKVLSKSSSILDMHLAPDDILMHFSPSGESTDGFSVLKQNSGNHAMPSPSVLADFKESMQLNYHGILYNVDELESEKYDRACRRLVEKCVKFETRSIGSMTIVPSHCIMPVGASPKKQILAVANSMQNSHCKKTHLKKVAEKLYQKRILKRKYNSQLVAVQGTSMTLRSTPKKQLRNISENIEIAPKEQKRHQQRTYVQDNKKQLEKLIASSLIDNGVPLNSKHFESCSRRLYNVCMNFLKKLKSSKNLDKIMKETVDENVRTVISFDA